MTPDPQAAECRTPVPPVECAPVLSASWATPAFLVAKYDALWGAR